ncbi:hypothetical protein C2E23DRAFT_883274 [Lenzites betulinus]|nr:hypothetical protein C2E23DRAFT_883274 [Lenzites betulinus]
MTADASQADPRVASLAVTGGHTVAAPQSIYQASITPPSDIQLTENAPLTPDTNSSRTAVSSSSSPEPASNFLDGPLTAAPNCDAASICGPNSIAPSTAESQKRIQYMSPCSVSWFLSQRYKDRYYTSAEPQEKEILRIPAINKIEPRPTTAGNNWELCEHPEGQAYFRRPSPHNDKIVFYTNTWLLNHPGDMQDMEDAVDLVMSELSLQKELPEDLDICLSIYLHEDGDKLVCYYIADRVKEVVFWLTEQSVDLLVELLGVQIFDPHHLSHSQQTSYWRHIEMFPHYRPYPAEQLQLLRSTLKYYTIDRITSQTSCVLYDPDDLHKFSNFCNDLKPPPEGEFVSELEMCGFARIQNIFAYGRLRHYHGTKWARLDANRSVRSDLTSEEYKYSWLFNIASFLLFLTPTSYMCRLDEVWLDANVNQLPWHTFIKELQQDWQESITPSTIILTASVGYLAIQSVDQTVSGTGLPVVDRSAGQIMAYVATLLSIGNIVSCTILGRQHRLTGHLIAADASNYLERRAGRRWHTERLAVILSIPTGFFLWSLCAFLGGTLWLCYNQTSLATRAFVSVVVVVVSMLLALAASNGNWFSPTGWLALPALTVKTTFEKIPVHRLARPLRKFTDSLKNARRNTTPPGEVPQATSPPPPRRAFTAPPTLGRVVSDTLRLFRRSSMPRDVEMGRQQS